MHLLVVAAVALDRRVRQRREEMEALRRSEGRFRSLVQASSQIVWTTAHDGRMVDTQASWEEFTGQTLEEYRDRGWFNAVHPDDREATARLWEEALADREPMEIEHRVRRRDGGRRRCYAVAAEPHRPAGTNHGGDEWPL
jgi:PAS domain S-box-containing protein